MAAKSAYLICNSYFSWKISSRNAGLVQQQNIINCGFGADNQVFQPAPASVLFDRKVPRITQLIIFAERCSSF